MLHSGNARDYAGADDGIILVYDRHLASCDGVGRLLELEREAAVGRRDARETGMCKAPSAATRVTASSSFAPTTTVLDDGSVRSTYRGRDAAMPSPRRCPDVNLQ